MISALAWRSTRNRLPKSDLVSTTLANANRLGNVTAVATGFATILVAVAVGYLLGGSRHFPPASQKTLAALAFNVGTPALMIKLMSKADLASVFSWHLAAIAAAAAVTLGASLILWRRLTTEQRVLGALSSVYLNSGNLGLPIALYVLGDAAWVAPILLLQVGLIQPCALVILDASRTKTSSLRGVLRLVFNNPVTLGTLAGLALSLAGLQLPMVLAAPVDLLAGLSIPLMLLTFGLGLRHSGLPRHFESRAITAIAAKSLFMPAVAWTVATVAGLPPEQIRAATVLAALPAAQVVLVHAIRYDTDQEIVQQVLFATTLLSLPVIATAALLLA